MDASKSRSSEERLPDGLFVWMLEVLKNGDSNNGGNKGKIQITNLQQTKGNGQKDKVGVMMAYSDILQPEEAGSGAA